MRNEPNIFPPARKSPDAKWEHFGIYSKVKEALAALPFYFRTDTYLSGLNATDIFTLNQTLGATIEEQVVVTLNQMRPLWDPVDQYQLYGFVRQPQTFPDVLLKRVGPEPEIVMGIELKGWYLLAKEGEPSFRYQVTPTACSSQDLLVIVPWCLTNILSGSPKVFSPHLEFAKFAAEYRNYHWQYLRKASSDTTLIHPEGISPYPRKTDPISDKPVADGGGNFGRFARTGLMDSYIQQMHSERLCGIESNHWLHFFKLFQEQSDSKRINAEIEKIKNRIEMENVGDKEISISNLLQYFENFLQT